MKKFHAIFALKYIYTEMEINRLIAAVEYYINTHMWLLYKIPFSRLGIHVCLKTRIALVVTGIKTFAQSQSMDMHKSKENELVNNIKTVLCS